MIKEPMKRIDRPLPQGDAGIDVTVSHMWRLANRDSSNPEIKAIALKYKSDDKTQTTKNIFDYVWKNYPYKSDPVGREQITAPIHMVNGNNPREDCDGLVTLLVSLLSAAGVKSRIKVIAWRLKEYTHVIAEFYDGEQWYSLDPTRKSDGWKNQVKPVIREKRYENPMDITTLEDGPDCACASKGKKGRLKNDNDNKIEINIGNSNQTDSHASSHNELMKGISATETSAMNSQTGLKEPISSGTLSIPKPIDITKTVSEALNQKPPEIVREVKPTINTNSFVAQKRYEAWS